MSDIDAKAMRATVLERRMEEFGDEWSYGIKQLRKFSKGAAKTLDTIEKAFDQLNLDLANELSKAAKKKVSAPTVDDFPVLGFHPCPGDHAAVEPQARAITHALASGACR